MRLLYLIQMVNGARVTRYPRKVTNIAQPSLSAHNSTLSANLRPPHPGQLPHFKSSVIPNQRHLRHRIIRPPLGSCFKSQSASSIALCMTGSNPPSVPHPWHKSATPVLIVIIHCFCLKLISYLKSYSIPGGGAGLRAAGKNAQGLFALLIPACCSRYRRVIGSPSTAVLSGRLESPNR